MHYRFIDNLNKTNNTMSSSFRFKQAEISVFKSKIADVALSNFKHKCRIYTLFAAVNLIER